MHENLSLENIDLSSIDAVKKYIDQQVKNIAEEGIPHLQIKDIIFKIFNINEADKTKVKLFDLNLVDFPKEINDIISSIENISDKSKVRNSIEKIFQEEVNKKNIIVFFKNNKKSVRNFIIRIMQVILTYHNEDDQIKTNFSHLDTTNSPSNILNNKKNVKLVNIQTVRDEIIKEIDNLKNSLTPSHEIKLDEKIPASNKEKFSNLISNMPYQISLSFPIILIIVLIVTGVIFWEKWSEKQKIIDITKRMSDRLDKIYLFQKDDEGIIEESGILKTLYDELFKRTKSTPKPQTVNLKPESSSFNEYLISPEKIKDMNDSIKNLKEKVSEFSKPIDEKIEIKLNEVKIREVFDSVLKDKNSELGQMIKKINEFGSKVLDKNNDTVSAKDKKDLSIVKEENTNLKQIILEREKEINKQKESVAKLNNEITLKAKNIKELEDKNLFILNEKTTFKGYSGSFAILLTNSKDFELTEPILSATLVSVEKQIKESNGVQKLGIYAATGNAIDVKFNLKKGTRGLKPTEMIVANARPTETIAEVGKTFLEFAFDDGKDPVIPINDRKAIIIATWAAGAPKDNDGWDKISQVDAILIQTPKANQLREGSSWLDFILKKNGRLLFVQAEEKITGSSPAIVQLQKHLSTLLNTKKD